MMKNIACSACHEITSSYHIHELLSVPICNTCHSSYHSGVFQVDDTTGNEIYCRWCGGGEGVLFLCDTCPKSFCERCLRNNFGTAEVERVNTIGNLWSCILCSPQPLTDLIQKNGWNEIDFEPNSPPQSSVRTLLSSRLVNFSPTGRKARKKGENREIRPPFEDHRIICYDVSRGRENFEIPVINEVDNEPPPLDFIYITEPVVSHGATFTNNPNYLFCCNCEDNCKDFTKCECIKASGGQNYSSDGRLLTGMGKEDGIYECNYKCKCHRRKCNNRVVSNGPQLKLELFRCENPIKGWGVRCKTEILPGTFIADYVGEILSEAMAEQQGLEKGDEYIFNMDSWARSRSSYKLSSFGFKDSLDQIPREYIVDASLMDENSLQQYFDPEFIEKLSKSGAIERAQEKGTRKRSLQGNEDVKWYEDYLSRRKLQWQESTYALGDRVMHETEERGESYSVDARWYGSIGRFLNHSCQPNLDKISVFCGTQNAMMPRIAFFATELIPAGVELCYDYGYFEGNVDGKHRTCLCGAENCRKRMY